MGGSRVWSGTAAMSDNACLIHLRLQVLTVPEGGCFSWSVCATQCICIRFCKWCLRSFGQPSARDHRIALPRAGNRGLVCDDCRSTNNWKYKTETAEDRKKRLRAMERTRPLRMTWQNLVFDWIEAFFFFFGGDLRRTSRTTGR